MKSCLARMKTNGVIALHDVLVEKYQLKNAVQKLAREHDVELLSLPYNYGLGLLRYTGKSAYGELSDSFTKKPEPQGISSCDPLTQGSGKA